MRIMMTQNLEQITTLELQTLINFACNLIIKEQETADFYEIDALKKAEVSFLPSSVIARNWKQIVAYAEINSVNIVTRRSNNWVYLPITSVSTIFIINPVTYEVWSKHVDNNNITWINLSTNIVSPIIPSTVWPEIISPNGECYIDPINSRILIPILVWEDSVSGDLSISTPESSFIGSSNATNNYQLGLSSIIPAPQEYVTVKMLLASGYYSSEELPGIHSAIESFEAMGEWEDIRQPYFVSDINGGLALDSNNKPILNPQRIINIPFRGELNTYYRRLVRDKNISPIVSRTAKQFEIIYWKPNLENMTKSDAKKFVSDYNVNVKVFMSSFFNIAMIGDDLYLRYCRIFIAWMTIIRFMSERMNSLASIDFMNTYELTNLLYSYGMYDFNNIPAIYLKRFAHLIPKLLTNKGTSQIFLDILDIFDLKNNVNIWKYYLLKFYPETEYVLHPIRDTTFNEKFNVYFSNDVTISGNSLSDLITIFNQIPSIKSAVQTSHIITLKLSNIGDPHPVSMELLNIDTNSIEFECDITKGNVDYTLPDVGFQKIDMSIFNSDVVLGTDINKIEDFQDTISNDPTWKATKEEVLNLGFSSVQSKYFSLSSSLDAVSNGFSLSLLWGMLKDAEVRGKGSLMIMSNTTVLENVNSLTFFEAMTAALTIILWQSGVEDIIPLGESGISTILSARTDNSIYPTEGSILPFSTSLSYISSASNNINTQTPITMTDSNISVSKNIDEYLVNTVKNGSTSYNEVLGGEADLDVDKITSIKNIWNYKFINTYQASVFNGFNKYSEWIKFNNPQLYNWLSVIDTDKEYVNGLLSLISIIEESITSSNLKFIQAFGVSETIVLYIEKMITFFKSYSTDLQSFSIFFLINRPASESLQLLNKIESFKANIDLTNPAALMRDEININSSFTLKDSLMNRTNTQRTDDIKFSSNAPAGSPDRFTKQSILPPRPIGFADSVTLSPSS